MDGRMVIINCMWKNKNDSSSEEPKPRETISTHQTYLEEWEKVTGSKKKNKSNRTFLPVCCIYLYKTV